MGPLTQKQVCTEQPKPSNGNFAHGRWTILSRFWLSNLGPFAFS